MRNPQPEVPSLKVALVCFALFLAVVALWLFTGCAPSRMGKSLDIGIGVSAAADIYTTRAAIDSGRGREANPLQDHGAWTQGLLKAAGTSATIGAAALIELKGNRTLAHVLRIAVIAVNAGIAIHNNGVGR